MHTLVPIKVKIGLRRVPVRAGRKEKRTEADHPDWNLVPFPTNGEHVKGDGNDETDFVMGSWHYDKTPGAGHQEKRSDSPMGMQWGMRLVTPQFAVNAVATFPDVVTIMTEAAAKKFFDERAYAHVPVTRVQGDALADLKAELELREATGLDTTEIKARVVKALDPGDPTEPGVEYQLIKYWDDHCSNCDFVIERPAKTKQRVAEE